LLADGIIWQHFTNFQPGNVKVERTLDITNDNPVDCAAYLVQRLDAAKFWPEEQTIDKLAQQMTQLESLVATLQQEIKRRKSGFASAAHAAPVLASGGKPASTTSRTESQKIASIDLDQVTDITGKRPSHFRLPDGTAINVKRWKDVLRESCKFALQSNPTISIPFPDRSGKKVALFSNVKPAAGISYITEDYNGQTTGPSHIILQALWFRRPRPIQPFVASRGYGDRSAPV
jgi:hypothetical protein